MALDRGRFVPSKTQVEKIDVPELEDCCFLAVLTAKERDGYDASVFNGVKRNIDNLSARLVVLCLCDEQGSRLFDNVVEGAKTLGEMPTTIIERLYLECRRINEMTPAAIEDAAKNSETTAGSSSSTD